MENNKISINKLINLNEDNIKNYNEYISFLRTIFRGFFSNIKKLDIIKTNRGIVLEIFRLDDNEKESYIDIIDSKDIKCMIVDGKVDEEKSNIIFSELRYVFEDIKKFCKENKFMNIYTIFQDDVSIGIYPNLLLVKYNNNNKKLIISYDGTDMKLSKKDAGAQSRFFYSGKSFDIYENNNMNYNDIKNILNTNFIDCDNIPSYLMKKKKKLLKTKGSD